MILEKDRKRKNEEEKKINIKRIKEDEIKDMLLSFSLPPLKLENGKGMNEIEKMFRLLEGIEMKINKQKAKKLCLRNDEKGNLIARGIKYLRGFDCKKDNEEAFKCFSTFEIENEKYKNELEKKDKREGNEKRMELGYCFYFLGLFFFFEI